MIFVKLSARARFDIEDALASLAQVSSTFALRWEDELYGALHRLSLFPLSAPVREDLAPAPTRVQVVGTFLVFYDPSQTPLVVQRVVRASRNLTRSFVGSGATE